MPFRILLADDHALFRHALRLSLETMSDIEVIAEASNGCEVLQIIDNIVPDIVCMDINMPKLNGIDTMTQIHAKHPKIKVIALSSHVDPHVIDKMIKAGALCYVDKTRAGIELPIAIHNINQNKMYISPCVGINDSVDLTLSPPNQDIA